VPSYFGTHRTTIIKDGRGWQWLRSGVEPESRPPVALATSSIFTRQEQPRHPLPQLFPGVGPRPVVSPSIRNWVLVQQQRPDHPRPYVFPGARPANPVAGAIYQTSVFVRQQFPEGARVLAPVLSNQSSPNNQPWEFAYTVQ